MYFSHGQKFPKNLQGCEFEKTPVSTSDIFMTSLHKAESFIFLTLILFWHSDDDILNSMLAFLTYVILFHRFAF